MILTRYAVCSDSRKKPVTRAVCDSRQEAERMLEQVRNEDAMQPEGRYWIVELGAEAESWRWLAPSS